MHIDAEVSHVAPGCAVYIPPHAVQYIENIGADELVFLCIVDPAWRRRMKKSSSRDRRGRILIRRHERTTEDNMAAWRRMSCCCPMKP